MIRIEGLISHVYHRANPCLRSNKSMFTIAQINDLHDRLGSAKTFPEYVRALKALGVERCDSYLADGHSEYFGQGGHRVVSPPVHEVLP